MVIDHPLRLLEVLNEVHVKHGALHLWWRGQSKSKWELTPPVYRGNYDPIYEMSITSHFRSRAPARYPNCPTNEVDWLFLMGHYGLPTRLMDWTESPLIALFFAVRQSKYDSESGALWVLDPGRLNELQIGQPVVITPPAEFPPAKRIAEEAFKGIQRDDADEIYAICPPHFDIRMVVQQAGSTIHATTTPMEQLENKQEFLSKIEVPSEQKEPLRRLLDGLGITQSTLFPDLEHLAKDLASATYRWVK